MWSTKTLKSNQNSLYTFGDSLNSSQENEQSLLLNFLFWDILNDTNAKEFQKLKKIKSRILCKDENKNVVDKKQIYRVNIVFQETYNEEHWIIFSFRVRERGRHVDCEEYFVLAN